MKEYNFAPQAWNSVFAVPGDVVDKYIKLAGAAQLKVLLWLLRNNSQDFSAKDIAASLSMQTPDVRDCIEFWVEAGLLYKNTSNHQQAAADDTSSFTQPTVITTAEKEKSSADNSQSEQKTAPRPISRAPRPDSLYVAQRINTDPQLASLMQEAQVILGRPLSHGDSSVLLMLHDNDGLPVDVILMVLQYSVSNGKGMKYVEKMGIGWAADGIDTLEKADEKIKLLSQAKEAWNIVNKTFGLKNSGSPTPNQIKYADKWLNQWNYSADMLRTAYEICVDTKGEYNMKYINGIIQKWHQAGIQTAEDYKTLANTKPQKTKAVISVDKKDSDDKASYDLQEYEKFSIFDNEE